MLHLLYPLPDIKGDFPSAVCYNLYLKPQEYLINTIKDIAERNGSERFSYRGIYLGFKWHSELPLHEDYHEEMDNLLIQYDRWNRESGIVRSFLLRCEVQELNIRSYLPTSLGGCSEASDIPEVKLIYARLLKNKLLG